MSITIIGDGVVWIGIDYGGLGWGMEGGVYWIIASVYGMEVDIYIVGFGGDGGGGGIIYLRG